MLPDFIESSFFIESSAKRTAPVQNASDRNNVRNRFIEILPFEKRMRRIARPSVIWMPTSLNGFMDRSPNSFVTMSK